MLLGQMIKEAILALNEKSGSSPYAIAKYMEDQHKAVLPSNFRKTLALQLKNSASKGKLTKVKASYKLSEAGKKESAKPAPRPTRKAAEAAKKPKEAAMAKAAPVPRAKRTRKPEAAKPAKKPVKKAAAAKPKQPKSIKSPAAKRAKKVAAA